MAFFSGDIDGNGGHDDLAKQIAYNGKDWTEKHWRKEDMEACERLSAPSNSMISVTY